MKSRTQWSFLILASLLTAVMLYAAVTRWGQIRNWFERERFDTKALAELELTKFVSKKTPDASAGWPQWRGPNRDGVAPAGPFRTDWKTNPPKVLWTAPCAGGYSQPIVFDGHVYLHDAENGRERLRCWDIDRGELKWEHTDAVDYSGFKLGYGSGPRATPTIHEGRIYTLGATGLFQCFSLPQGKETNPTLLWKHDLLTEFSAPMPSWGVASSPLIVEDKVVVQPGGKSGSIAAFHRETGRKLWSAGSDPSGYSSPIFVKRKDEQSIIAVTGRSVLGLSDAGEIQWSVPFVTQFDGNIATPISVDDYVFVSSNYGKGCALFRVFLRGSGSIPAQEIYFRKNRVMSNHHSTCVYKMGFLYGYDGEELVCVDLKKGERVSEWHATDDEGREFAKGSLTLKDGNLVGLTQTGTLFLGTADSKEFTFLGQVKNVLKGRECWTSPVIVDGRIYLRDAEKLVCLDVG
ncbi:MAG: PQQ-binding-like beta-propeller repeat protein [Gemmataceae bacterium]